MSLSTYSVESLIRIVAAGGGLRIDGKARFTEDLIRIAAAASAKGARITISGMSTRGLEDLIRIGAAGKGTVSFED